MKHLNNEWRKIRKKIGDSRIALFLDFDGTLTPIQDRPKEVFLDPYTKNIIEKLVRKSRVSVSVISGRELSDVEEKVGVKGVTYSGNHGLEIKGPFGRRKLAEAVKSLDTMKEIKACLEEALSGIHDIYIEDKGLTLSVHFRLVPEKYHPNVDRIFTKAVKKYVSEGRIIVTHGKKVLEVRPPADWNKGKIVKYILEKMKRGTKRYIVPVYIGDDVTDEDAFYEVNDIGGYSVKICSGGKDESHARYFLKGPEEVTVFLSELYITERLRGE